MNKATRLLVDDTYKIALVVKGVDGALEFLGGLFLLLFPSDVLHGIIANIATYDLVGDPHNIIRVFILYLDKHLTNGLQLFAGVYLLLYGAIKVFLAIALIKKLPWAYPIATTLLTIFILYQAYEVGFTHSASLGIVTALDVLILILVQFEYGRLKRSQ